jgi:uncharacterized membrane protein YkvA (DUF1232 family)
LRRQRETAVTEAVFLLARRVRPGRDTGSMGAIFIRLAILAGLWAVRKWTSRRPTPLVREVGALSWPSKARLIWRLVRDERVPFWARGLALLPALYLLSPIDLLPDFIPFAGRLDDALVFAFVADLLLRVVPSEVLQEHMSHLGGRRS